MLNTNSKQKYFYEINFMRAFIILTIVFGHMLSSIGYINLIQKNPNDFGVLAKMISQFITNNSALFVFVSGFLFYSIFYKRGFTYKSFMIGKSKKLLCPYFIFVILSSCECWLFKYFISHQPLYTTLGGLYSTTLVNHVLWYIPFIMLMFALSPLHVKFIETTKNRQIMFFLLCVIITLIVGRFNQNPIQQVLYYFSFYLWGLLCSIYYDKVYIIISKYSIYLILVYLLISYALSSNDIWHDLVKAWHHGNVGVYPLSLNAIIKYIECIWGIGIGMLIQFNLADRVKLIVEKIAKYSFSIYFLHNIMSNIVRQLFIDIKFVDISYTPWGMFACSIILTIIAVYICLIISEGVKKYFDKKSRYLIGA